MNNTSNTESTKYWVTTKVFDHRVITFINTKLSNGAIYTRPIKDDDGNPLSLGEFFGKAGQLERMYANSSNAKQDAKLELDNKELLALAHSKAIQVTDNINI
jgi:hypothetical protein